MPVANYYIVATGEVVDAFAWDEDTTAVDWATLNPTGGSYIIDDELDPDVHYIVAGVKTDRPLLADDQYSINNDGADSVTITLPSGTVIDYDYYLLNQQTSAAEDWIFTSTIVGTFIIKFDPAFPYQDQVVRISVNDDNS